MLKKELTDDALGQVSGGRDIEIPEPEPVAPGVYEPVPLTPQVTIPDSLEKIPGTISAVSGE